MKTRLFMMFFCLLVCPVVVTGTEEKRVYNARARKSSGKKPKRKTARDMTYEELKVMKDKRIAESNWDGAMIYLERMMKCCDNLSEMATILLDMADVLFNTGLYDKASKIYQELIHLYPGHERIEYALYRAVDCSFKCIFSAERDQTKTEETIKLADEFLARRDIFSTYVDAVEDIRTQCYQTLTLHDINVCLFYLKRGSVEAARKRLDHITKTWQPYLAAFQSDINYITQALANPEEAELIMQSSAQPVQKTKMSERF